MRIMPYKIFTIKDLRELLAELPNDMPVLVEGTDSEVLPIVSSCQERHTISDTEEPMLFLKTARWIE